MRILREIRLPQFVLTLVVAASALADDVANEDEKTPPSQVAAENGGNKGAKDAGNGGENGEPKSKFPKYGDVLKDTTELAGLLTLHKGDEKLFVELKRSDFDKDFFVLITIAKGIGQRPLLGGYSWGFGDDWVWQFRRVGDRVHVVRRNVRFTAKSGSPSEEAVKLAYTDSVLFSLPIATTGPGGTVVLDMSPVLLSDLPQIGQVLPGFTFSPSKSNWAGAEAHPKNVEIQVAATYASKGTSDIETVADSRGVTVNVHYSISRLPKTDYVPRLADDRIGYFLTVV